MGKAQTVITVIVVGALTLGLLPLILTFYTSITGQELPLVWRMLIVPIAIFTIAWILVAVAVFSIKRSVRKEMRGY